MKLRVVLDVNFLFLHFCKHNLPKMLQCSTEGGNVKIRGVILFAAWLWLLISYAGEHLQCFQKDFFNINLHNKQPSYKLKLCFFDILFRYHFDLHSEWSSSTFQVCSNATCADPIGEEY